MQNKEARIRRWPFVVSLVIGIALILAPVTFQMFSRAPQGGRMITAFKPYMTEATISGFQGDMATIGRAVDEARTNLGAPSVTTPASYNALLEGWDGINTDMSSMLRTMHGDIGDYQAVRALPPFPLFPWFFVAPGVLLVGVSTWGLLRRRAQRSGKPALVALVVLGLGLVAAPAIFQMWDRAPKGGHMINDFAPLMTEAKVTKVQGYFLVLADGEAVLRNQMVPAYLSTSTQSSEATALPAIEAFSARWPSISSTMAPMIGAMSDNLGNYASVKAMPPFPLFPWFFAVPGLIVALTAGSGLLLARRDRRPAAAASS